MNRENSLFVSMLYILCQLYLVEHTYILNSYSSSLLINSLNLYKDINYIKPACKAHRLYVSRCNDKKTVHPQLKQRCTIAVGALTYLSLLNHWGRTQNSTVEQQPNPCYVVPQTKTQTSYRLGRFPFIRFFTLAPPPNCAKPMFTCSCSCSSFALESFLACRLPDPDSAT
jgi:hypothetical protein